METDWNCHNCWTDNPHDVSLCRGCGQPRDDERFMGVYRQDRELQKLMRLLNFTSEDIFHNRRGELSQRQKTTLKRAYIKEILLWVCISIYLVLTAVQWVQAERMVFSRVLLGFLVAIMVYSIAFYFFRRKKPKSEFPPPYPRRIIRLQGTLSKDFNIFYSRYKDVSFHHLKIGDFELRVSRDIYDAFVNGQAYALYLVSDTQQIITAEPISDRNLSGASVVDSKRVLDD